MDSLIEKRKASVIIIDPASTRRAMLSEVIRAAGFTKVNPMPSGKDLLRYLETESADWVILTFQTGDGINALQILQIVTQQARFVRTRISIIGTSEERECLPLAFELGLLSWHSAAYSRDEMEPQLKDLLTRFESVGWKAPILAAEYLREHLLEKKAYSQLQKLYHHLLEIYPGTATIVLRLAEVRLIEGALAEADVLLHQTQLLNPMLQPAVDSLRQRYKQEVELDDPLGEADFNPPKPNGQKANILGINTCVVIDPDSTVQYAIENLLRDAGVPEVRMFDNGQSAWAWLKSNPAPGLLIQEWRLPQLTGPLFLQRLRQEAAMMQVPIIVASSLIRKADQGLVLEMGVSAVIDKPFDQETFFRTVVTSLQQQRCPTEQVALERRIIQLLETNQLGEAKRLFTQLKADPHIADGAKIAIQAQLAFFENDLVKARDLALAALQEQGDSLLLLNLLGKCLLKRGETEAALKCFGRAQEMSPSNLERLCRMAEAEIDQGNNTEAEKIINKAKEIDPQNNMVLSAEAGLALAIGDTKRASSVIGQLESVGKLLAFMNNRAVALTLSGRFEEGIDLYKRTTDALPLPWGRTHDAVVYNLSLAYARYGDLEKAEQSLKRILQTPGTVLAKKAEALRIRIKNSRSSGTALVLAAAGPVPSSNQVETAASKDKTPLESLTLALDVRRGDICLHLLYRAMELASSKALEHLKNLPPFVDRKSSARGPQAVAGDAR